jgi:hypothetical protein
MKAWTRSTSFSVPIAAIFLLAISTTIALLFPMESMAQRRHSPEILAAVADTPIAVSGNNVYTSWPNNDTGHWDVFLPKVLIMEIHLTGQ